MGGIFLLRWGIKGVVYAGVLVDMTSRGQGHLFLESGYGCEDKWNVQEPSRPGYHASLGGQPIDNNIRPGL